MLKALEVTWDLPVVVTMMEDMDMDLVQVLEVKTKLALIATLVRLPEVVLDLVPWKVMMDLAQEVMLDLVLEVMKDQTVEVMKEPLQEVTKELLLEAMQDLEVTQDLEAMQDQEVTLDLEVTQDQEVTLDLEVTQDLEVTLDLTQLVVSVSLPEAFVDADLTDFEFTR